MNLLIFLAQVPTVTPAATAGATVALRPAVTAAAVIPLSKPEPFWHSTSGIFLIIAIAILAGIVIGLLFKKADFGAFLEKLFADFTNLLAYLVVIFAFIGIFFLAWQIIKVGGGEPFDAAKALDTAKYVFGAVLPLLGTWVGAVLAHYFQKENLTAATQSITTLASKVAGGSETLQSIPVKNVMIRPERIETLPDPLLNKTDKDIKLSELLAHLREGAKKDRLPIFKDNKKIGPAERVLHRNNIEKFVTSKTFAAGGASPPTVADLTLADLMADPELGPVVRGSFALVGADATLAEAKDRMDLASNALGGAGDCYDVFVTQTGKPYEVVIGWITNDIINENAKV
jgi:hypothetical protein